MTLKSVVYKIPNKPENSILQSDFDNEITIDATSLTSLKGRPNKEYNKFWSYSSLLDNVSFTLCLDFHYVMFTLLLRIFQSITSIMRDVQY